MRAIIHSIHSQVPITIAEEGMSFRSIISLDSHLDVSLGGDEDVYPEELRIIVARTGAHAALGRIIGEVSALRESKPRGALRPGVTVVIPEAMLARHAEDIESRLPRSLRILDYAESIRSYVDFLADTMGIDVYQSPPESLLKLAGRTKGGSEWLLDVDVDYMHEMQGECYTRIYNPGPGVLQKVGKVVAFIEKSKPETITISEARVSAIRDSRSHFSAFIEQLKALGYSIEERGVYASDAEVIRGISVCREFYRTVSARLMARNMGAMMEGDMERFRNEEAAEARTFFRKKGYGSGATR